jgi:cysteine desulfurase
MEFHMSIAPIYLDYAATTPVDPRVLDVMLPFFTEDFGNAASASHTHGERAMRAVKMARRQVADLINAQENEIVFTSGATEAINLALKGAYQNYKHKGNHIITVVTEHKAVLDTCDYLEEIGADITYLSVDKNGLIDFEELKQAIKPSTILVAIMTANNETGVLQDIAQIGSICQQHNILFFTDATQAFGKIPLDVVANNIDLLSFSGHKIYGPKGIGGLYIKKGIKPSLQMHGGGHEFGFRSGTLNVPAIVGMGAAAALAQKLMEHDRQNLEAVRNEFEDTLIRENKIKVNGFNAPRLPHISNIVLLNRDADEFILANKHKLSVALGSACTSNIIEPSHVLKAMHLTTDELNRAIRVSFGRNYTNIKKTLVTLF